MAACLAAPGTADIVGGCRCPMDGRASRRRPTEWSNTDIPPMKAMVKEGKQQPKSEHRCIESSTG